MTSTSKIKTKSNRIRDALIMGAAATFAIVFAAINGSSNTEKVEQSQPVVSGPTSAGLTSSTLDGESAAVEVTNSPEKPELSTASIQQYVVVPFPVARTRAS